MDAISNTLEKIPVSPRANGGVRRSRIQSQGVIATVKHFAANNMEYGRWITAPMLTNERSGKSTPAFEASVKEAKAGAV